MRLDNVLKYFSAKFCLDIAKLTKIVNFSGSWLTILVSLSIYLANMAARYFDFFCVCVFFFLTSVSIKFWCIN